MKVLDGLAVEELDRWIEQFIDREDPDVMSFEALDQAARLRLAELPSDQVELTGTIHDGQISLQSEKSAVEILSDMRR